MLEFQGLAGEGLLRGPRRRQDRLPGRDQEGVPQAGPGAAPGPQPGQHARPRSGSRPSPRRTTCSPTSASGASTTRCARCSARARSGAAPGPASSSSPFDLNDFMAAQGGAPPGGRRPALRRGRLHRPVRHHLRWRRRAAGAPARAAARPRRRGRGDARLRRRGARGHAADHAARARASATPATATGPGPAPSRGRARSATAPGWSAPTRARSSFTEPCRECQGVGTVVDEKCPECRGTGGVTKTRTLNVRIPAGVSDGQRIRLAGRGEPGERGGPAGDLHLLVKVRPDSVFGRDGDDLTLTVPISYAEAVFGTDLRVPTMDGSVTVRVPPGTPSGRTLRVRGRGVPEARRRARRPAGDARGRRAAALSPEARKALEEYALHAPAPTGRHRRDPSAGTSSAAATPGRTAVGGERVDDRRVLLRRGHVDDAKVLIISVAARMAGHAPADPAPVRPDGPGPARPGRRRRSPLQRARRGAAPRGAAAEPGRRASTSPASSGSSSWSSFVERPAAAGRRAGARAELRRPRTSGSPSWSRAALPAPRPGADPARTSTRW